MKTRLLLAIALAAACASASAADKLVLPVAPVLAQPATQKVLKGVSVSFGAAAGAAAAPGAEIKAMSWARPNDQRGYDGGPDRTSDGRAILLSAERTCQLALRYTLENLADEAIARGGKAVTGIVSNNEGGEFNSPGSFECLPARSSATVNLKGWVTR
jgi:hypothetical protein